MLPRGAQIEKVRAEINSGLLKKYGKMTKLEIDKENKTINVDLDLKGEKECIQIRLSNYRLIQEDGKNPVFEPGMAGKKDIRTMALNDADLEPLWVDISEI